MKTKKLVLLTFTVILSLTISGCSSPQTKKTDVKYFGMLSYLPQETEIAQEVAKKPENKLKADESYEGIYECKSYDTISALKLALDAGQISYIAGIPHMTAQYLVAQDSSLTLIDDDKLPAEFVMILRVY